MKQAVPVTHKESIVVPAVSTSNLPLVKMYKYMFSYNSCSSISKHMSLSDLVISKFIKDNTNYLWIYNSRVKIYLVILQYILLDGKGCMIRVL